MDNAWFKEGMRLWQLEEKGFVGKKSDNGETQEEGRRVRCRKREWSEIEYRKRKEESGTIERPAERKLWTGMRAREKRETERPRKTGETVRQERQERPGETVRDQERPRETERP